MLACLIALRAAASRWMQKYQWISTQTLADNINNVSRSEKSCPGIAHSTFALEPALAQPLVREREPLAAMIVL
jgi:hypothetical protein